MPLAALDALLLLPDGTALATSGSSPSQGGRFLQLTGATLSLVQAERARYSLAGTAPTAQRAALAAAAQFSDEMLSRGVMLGFAALWLNNRQVNNKG